MHTRRALGIGDQKHEHSEPKRARALTVPLHASILLLEHPCLALPPGQPGGGALQHGETTPVPPSPVRTPAPPGRKKCMHMQELAQAGQGTHIEHTHIHA